MAHELIESRFLNSRDLFALRYNEGLVFLEVEEFEDVEYEAFSNLEDISSGSNLTNGFQRIQDTNNDDLLFVPSDDDDVVMHVGFGIAPAVIEAFVSYPEGSRQNKSLPNLSAQGTPGANFGHVDGDDSPYREPTIESELVIPPKQRISMDFQNPGDDAHEPLLKFMFRKYRVNVLEPDPSSPDRRAISRIVGAGSPAPIFPVGNFEVKADFNLRDEWDVNPVKRKKMERALSGGKGQ